MMAYPALRLSVPKSWVVALCVALLLLCCGCSKETPISETGAEEEAVSEEIAQGAVTVDGEMTEGESQPQDMPQSVINERPQDITSTSEQTTNVLSGTCVIVNAEQLLKMQGMEGSPTTFGSEPEDRFALILFDRLKVLYSHAPGDADKMMYRETDMICVAIDGRRARADISVWEPYDGMLVTVQFDSFDIWNPSDARLPLGKPFVNNVVLVYAE